MKNITTQIRKLKISAIIYSRLNSKRLKNKAIIKIGKKTLIEQVIDNVKKIKNIDNIILATTNLKNDKKLTEIATKNKINFFCGSKSNLINRTIECSKKYNFDYFLRVCGDRFYFDYNMIDLQLKKIKEKNIQFDMMSSNVVRKVDQGLTIEVVSAKALKKIVLNNKRISNYNKEHLTSIFYKFRDKHNIKTIKLPSYFYNGFKYTVDIKKDIERIKFISNNIKKNSFKELLRVTRLWEK